jgi:hypothetical protein
MINHNSNLIEVVRNKSIPIADGLVFWYRYGTYQSGSSTWNDAYFGNLNAEVVSSSFIQDSGSQGWDFNHTSSQAAYLNITTGSNASFFPTGSYTFLLYGLLDTDNVGGSAPNASGNQLFSRDSEPFVNGWYWNYDGLDKTIEYQSQFTTSGTSSVYTANVLVSASVSSSLTLFGMTVDAVGQTGSVFVDSTLIGQFSGSGIGTNPQNGVLPFSVNSNTSPVWVGNRRYTTGAPNVPWSYRGTIKHTLLYNRVLTSTEQFQIYQFFKFNSNPLF